MKQYKVAQYVKELWDAGLLVSVPALSCAELKVTNVTYDSRKVMPGSLFVCKGKGFKLEYLDKAFEQGAVAYVSEIAYDQFRPTILVSDIRQAMAVLANFWDCCAWKDYPLVGLTGTKGKSTTAYYIKAIAELHSKKLGLARPGIISTIDTYDGIEEFESHLTTPEALELAERFINASSAKLPLMIMEVSSQALKYHRTDGIDFSIGAFLNYGLDHIGGSEHNDEEDYISSKLKLFEQSRIIILNKDMDRYERINAAAENSSKTEKIIRFSTQDPTADYYSENVRKDGGRTVFELKKAGTDKPLCTVSLSMPGLFNVENAVAAAAICLELGIPAATVAEGLAEAKAKGRMELFSNAERGVDVIVDYAHNELSFRKLFESVKTEFPGRSIQVLFGCPGGKGLSRREDLPAVVAEYADYAWITEEDPADEDPVAISETVLANLNKHGCSGRIIIDREEAVKTAIEEAAPGTVLILAAKGREEYQHRGNEYVKILSDVALTEKYL